MWNPFRRRRRHETVAAPASIEFLAEQDGPGERLLKERLVALFANHPNVVRAYLVRVRYEGESDTRVVLCLLGRHTNTVFAEIGGVFHALFDRRNSLDSMFVSLDEEERILPVCRPFYLAR